MDEQEIGQFLFESGLLFEINRKTLHPVGLSMVWHPDQGLIMYDHSKYSEMSKFDEDQFKNGKKKIEKYMIEFGIEAMKRRKEKLGYIVQGMFGDDN